MRAKGSWISSPRLVLGMLCLWVATLAPATAYSSEIVQSFESAWTIEPWDYNGDVAAMQWHYIPYEIWDSSLGILTAVEVRTAIHGERELTTDSVAIRYSFFTGWSPADYQLYDAISLAPGDSQFSTSREFVYSTPGELQHWLTYDYLPGAHYYFESRTVDGAHTISATTTLTYIFTEVPEPSTLVLFGLGLLGLGFARRRA